MKDMDIIELNEAFSAQALACIREWGLKDDDPRKILRRDFDENEIIDFITLNDHPHPRIEWSLELEQGTYKFSSFKSLLTRLKNKPPF